MCTLDAHIYDEHLWDKIKGLTLRIQYEGTKISRLKSRIERVKAFISHLETIEEKWIIEASRRNLNAGWLKATIHTRLRPLIEADCDRALMSAQGGFAKA
jgi:hypothetical protein